MSSLVKVCFFCPFSIFLVDFWEFFIYSRNECFIRYVACKCFLPGPFSWSFYPANKLLDGEEVFKILVRSSVSICHLIDCVSVVKSKNYFLNPWSWRFSPFFFFCKCVVVCFTVKFIFPFELIWMWDVRFGLYFFFTLASYWKGSLSSMDLLLHLGRRSVVYIRGGLLTGFSVFCFFDVRTVSVSLSMSPARSRGLKSNSVVPPALSPLLSYFWISESILVPFHIDFRISLCIAKKSFCWDLDRNWVTSRDRFSGTGDLSMLSPLIHESSMYLHLITCWTSSFSFLSFRAYQYYLCFLNLFKRDWKKTSH